MHAQEMQVRPIIIGTAGHVDHGKTELVRRLTGLDTDRLKEEKARGISIELGFAPLILPGGQQAGLVDVPGHEKFIKHMLAGVAGIDLVLFVVAADEGVRPQTLEHLAIINLLEIEKGLIVLTKKDLVEEEWLLLVEEEVREALRGTVLEDAPQVSVSARTGAGIDALLAELATMAAGIKHKVSLGKPRLPIDRVFSMTGFGTVVTGTLFAGRLQVGDTVEVLPEGILSRVRGIQIHGEKVETALAGQRVAVNLSGVETRELKRGSVLLTPGSLQPSYRLDVQLELLFSAGRPLKNWTRLRFHQGTKETLGRVVLLEKEELAPGEKTYAQFVMEEPVVVARRDRFVIRTYSPMFTIGGGSILDPAPGKQKRFQPEVLQALAMKEQGTPEELILQHLISAPIPLVAVTDLPAQLGLSEAETQEGLKRLKEENRLVQLALEGIEYLVHPQIYNAWQEDLWLDLKQYHQAYPLRIGFSREELRSRKFKFLSVKPFNALLQYWAKNEEIALHGQMIALPGHRPKLSEEYRLMLEQVKERYQSAGLQPPLWDEVKATLKLEEKSAEELLNYCLQQKILHKITEAHYLTEETLARSRALVLQHFQEHASLTIGEARELLGSSRKYILPLLEFFDREKVTRRIEDKRVKF